MKRYEVWLIFAFTSEKDRKGTFDTIKAAKTWIKAHKLFCTPGDRFLIEEVYSD